MADHFDRAGRHVVRVVGGLIELERFSRRRVIPRGKPSDAHMLCSAIHGAVSVSGAEAATEPAPSDAIVVQEVADVPTGLHENYWPRAAGIATRRAIPNEGSLHDHVWDVADVHAMGLARDEVD